MKVRNFLPYGCGFQARDEQVTQIYHINNSDLCLSGTAELPMV
jgi:seryl-tRNA synthetase